MKIFFKLFLPLIIIIFFSGCAKKINTTKSKESASWSYTIGIEGVECKLCAYKVVKRLEKLETLFDVKMICSNDFKECCATFTWGIIQNNMPVKDIVNTIATEGFDVKYISGNFIGSFDSNLEKFTLSDSGITFKFMNTQNSNIFVTVNQRTVINAKLVFQKKANQVWLQMN